MKILKFVTLVLVLAGSFYSCEDKNCGCKETINLPKEKVCDVTNPLTDLPWLKEYIDDIKKYKGTSKNSPFIKKRDYPRYTIVYFAFFLYL